MASLDEKLREVVGEKTAKVLGDQLGLLTIGDLLRHYPRRYVVRGELTDIESLLEGEEVTIFAKIESSKVRRIPGRKGSIMDVIVTDGRAKLGLKFFMMLQVRHLNLQGNFSPSIRLPRNCHRGRLVNALN